MPSHLCRVILALIFLSLSALAPLPSYAQAPDDRASPLVEEQRDVLKRLQSRTEQLEKSMREFSEDDLRLAETRLQLEEVGRELIVGSTAFRPRLAEINDRLEQLGPPPASGAPPESEIIKAERAALAAEKSEINATLGTAEDLSIRVNNLVSRVADLRRELFSKLLTKRYEINLDLAGQVVVAFENTAYDFWRSISAWLRFVFNFKLSSVLTAAFFALVAAAVLMIGGRRLFGHLIGADPEQREPTYLSRLSVAFWSTLLPSAALGVFLGATYFFFDYFGVLRGDIGSMLAALFAVIGLVFFVHRLGGAVLSPRLPEWRLIPVRSGAATKLLWIMSAVAAFSGVDFLLVNIYEALDAPLALTVGEALIATVLIGVLVAAGGLVKPFRDQDGRPRPWPLLVRCFLYLLGVVTIIAALLGYIGLARFISQQIVWTGALLVTMYIGFLSSRAVSEEGAFAKTRVGKRFKRWLNLDETGLDQLGLAASLLINIIVVILGLPLILLQWGFQPGDMMAWVRKVATGVQIGSFTLSLTGLLWGVLVFVIGYFLTRWFQRWLDGSVMARGRVDLGVRNSIRTVVGYAGLALAALVSVSAAGIDLSNIALIAGGLSLGIGFGLQNVVSNFVSGLILLVERPFKAGDWIVAGQVSGTVRKISVRATEIETGQRQTVILPNSELINSAVGNWTHRNKIGRIEVPVAVAYGTDARTVYALLLEIVQSHPAVLKNPEPFVSFVSFGETAMNFEAQAFLPDVTAGGGVRNDLRFAILDAFEREGIQMPFPQKQVRVWEEHEKRQWQADDDRAHAELEATVERREEALKEVEERGRLLGRKRRKRGTEPVDETSDS
ncbi:mechanosensitive ion channel family protein [Pseudaminobacter sp. 19-2017]|uniref:Mechanosensitive ion channel family protein n=1 Tax=Pseudaminobacter soli (ex Zhang et al. 2022) TaxID=2831468 RepID=A0A942DZY6_9HYPH|nr:mechanosensitive ion channel family protein [Pseudaminobacter soli]MBS3651309.1 mechanosensitive ion channel family protein [Pseudaminobacter soli]